MMNQKITNCSIKDPFVRVYSLRPHVLRAVRAVAYACAIVWLSTNTSALRADDCIRPSPDVVDGVTIRAAPNSSRQALGKLRPNQNLPLIAVLPKWYETRLGNGQTAFVSKRWTDLVPCAGVAPPSLGGAAAFELHAIDVGTGLAVLVRGPDFSLILDSGSNDDFALGSGNRVVAYLRTLQPAVAKIQHLILTHPHRDHAELLPDVFSEFEIENVWNSGAFHDICGYRHFLDAIAARPSIQYHTATQDGGVETIDLSKKTCNGREESKHTISLNHQSRIGDQSIPLGENASMKFLYADGSKRANPNENSLVVRLDLGPHRVLLMGDAEAGGRKVPTMAPSTGSIEGKLLACCAADLKADILVVGHHGSKSSSRTAFLDAVGARFFVISSGPTKYAKVTLPDAEVVSELESRGQVFRTDIEDDQCVLSPDKVGPDADGKAGGCDNIIVTLPANGAVSAQYRQFSD